MDVVYEKGKYVEGGREFCGRCVCPNVIRVDTKKA